jgi:hypothetical protein
MRHDAKRDEALRFVFEGGNLCYARAPRAPLEVGPCFSTIVLNIALHPLRAAPNPMEFMRARGLCNRLARARVKTQRGVSLKNS